jgi:hypothetical protein
VWPQLFHPIWKLTTIFFSAANLDPDRNICPYALNRTVHPISQSRQPLISFQINDELLQVVDSVLKKAHVFILSKNGSHTVNASLFCSLH